MNMVPCNARGLEVMGLFGSYLETKFGSKSRTEIFD